MGARSPRRSGSLARRRVLQAAGGVVAASALGVACGAQTPEASPQLSALGEAVRRRLLAMAWERSSRGDTGPFRLTLEFDVTPRPKPPLPRTPSPNDIDVCYEMCGGGLGCYVECHVPLSLQSFHPPSTAAVCAALWKEYEAEPALLRITLINELVRNGCLTLKQAEVAFVALDQALPADRSK